MSLSSLALDAFYACAQARSFTRAAERLHITQSALSQRIQNLEDEIGTTLLIRERNQLRLTDQGESLLRYCKTREGLENEVLGTMQSPLHGFGAGVLRIGGFSSVMRSVILPSLTPLLKQPQAPQLKLMVRETYELLELLRAGEIDYMILDEKISKENLECVHLGDEVYVLTQTHKYRGPEIYLDQDEQDTATLKFLAESSNRKSKKEIKRSFFDDIYGIIDGVQLGLGLAVLPLHIASKTKGLEIVNHDRKKSVPFYLYFHKQPYYTQRHEAVVSALKKNVPRFL